MTDKALEMAQLIQKMTYSEGRQLGVSLRDIMLDMRNDGSDMDDAVTVFEMLHRWAEGYEENEAKLPGELT